ncbi:hypothetical protein DZF92_08490 [Clavibacter michiganensis subsp. insidiosus]|uniref:Uncharacterized protein n=1 Tax=Clavibacter michiganensis subsp. insidiosus TaxID=33014 RepID=A0A399MYS9_9MICO|nr:hypothetical protein DZF92_08490 [Clavibacter michiganensis subsp. insidiosus]RIJ43552.1 hypothetical protein DZF93_06125 [Clavibacter michiganensis subsp. insidiosus]
MAWPKGAGEVAAWAEDAPGPASTTARIAAAERSAATRARGRTVVMAVMMVPSVESSADRPPAP